MVLPIIVLFIIGAAFGSFLSVVIHRVHKNKKGIFFGKSQCPHCHKKLISRDLIPVLSFIINGGKCRKCKKSINVHYLLLEILTGFAFVVFYLLYPFILINADVIFELNLLLFFLYFAVISVFLIGILFFDIKYMEVPEVLTYPAIVFVFIAGIFLNQPGFYSMVVGGALAGIFFGAQVWISKEKWLGAGDVQVGILMGLVLGWQLFLVGLIITYVFGSIISIVLLSIKKVGLKSQVPFAPFLVLGTFVTIIYGEYLLNLYLNSLI